MFDIYIAIYFNVLTTCRIYIRLHMGLTYQGKKSLLLCAIQTNFFVRFLKKIKQIKNSLIIVMFLFYIKLFMTKPEYVHGH